MLLMRILMIALTGHSLVEAVPIPLGAKDDPRKPILVFATDGEANTNEDEQKATGFRRSIPPGGGLGLGGFGNGGFGNSGFDTGLGAGFVANSGLGFGNGLFGNSFAGNVGGFGDGLPGNSFAGNTGSFGSGLMGNNFVGNGGLGIRAGLAGGNFVGTGFGSSLGNNFVGNGIAGDTFGIGSLNPVLQGSLSPWDLRNTMAYSPFGINFGGLAGSAGVTGQPGLGSGYWPTRQGLMNTNNFNGFSGVGSFNDLSNFSGLGSNGLNGFNGISGFNNFAGVGGLSSLGGVNTFRNTGTGGMNSLGSWNGFNTGTGLNNFGSLSNGINGFSSMSNEFNTPNNGLNNGFSSFIAGGSFNNNPTRFGLNPSGESNYFKRSPLDPTSPYYIQLYNNEDDQKTDSGWSGDRNSGQKATSRGTNAVTTQSAGSQVRSNLNTSV